MRYELRVLAVFVSILLFYNVRVSAEEKKISAEDALIGSTFKTLAKLFIAAQNKDRLVQRLNKMDEQKFQRRYARVYRVIKDSPNVLNRYGFKENMNKSAVVSKIMAMEKKEMLAVIDSIADTVIANQFKLYMLEKKQALQKTNIIEQITGFWNKLIADTGFK